MLVLRSGLGHIRDKMMISNYVESVNSVFKYLRELHVATMLNSIIYVLQKWFYERSKAAFAIKRRLTSWVENVLCLEHEKSRSLLVSPMGSPLVVHPLEYKTDRCIRWKH